MIGGGYTPHPPVKCELPFSRGFRSFDSEQFKAAAQKMKSPDEIVKGKFEVEAPEEVEKVGEIVLLNLENYLKMPRSKRLQEEFADLKHEIIEESQKKEKVKELVEIQAYQNKIET